MVASRSTHAPARPIQPAYAESAPSALAHAQQHDAPEDYARYSVPIDQTAARFDPSSNQVEIYDYHECFKEANELSDAEAREFAIKQCAVRIVCGMELRSLRTLAKHIGCYPSAIDNCVLRICKKVNMRKFHVSDTTRQRQSEARRKSMARS